MILLGTKASLAAVALGLCGAFGALVERPVPTEVPKVAAASRVNSPPEYCRQPRNDAEQHLNQAISSVLGCAPRR
jgi:hypothetical protein